MNRSFSSAGKYFSLKHINSNQIPSKNRTESNESESNDYWRHFFSALIQQILPAVVENNHFLIALWRWYLFVPKLWMLTALYRMNENNKTFWIEISGNSLRCRKIWKWNNGVFGRCSCRCKQRKSIACNWHMIWMAGPRAVKRTLFSILSILCAGSLCLWFNAFTKSSCRSIQETRPK